MNIKILPYHLPRDSGIDAWSADADISRFATDSAWSEEVAYYLADPDSLGYILGENCFALTAFDGESDEPVAAALAVADLTGTMLKINPVIVNPRLRRRGYGYAFIQKLAADIDILTKRGYNRLGAGIFFANTASIALFEKCGFVRVSTHPDGDYGEWEMEL